MYRSFFGLQRLPFEDRPDAYFFHQAPDREEALAELSSAPRPGKSLALIVGGEGMGKTMLIRAMLTRMPASDHVVVLTIPVGGGMDLARETCKGFGTALPASNNRARGLAKLRRHMRRTAKGGGRSILVIDQAENLTSENLEQLAAVSFLRTDAGSSKDRKEDLRAPSLLTIVLAAQPQLMPLLERSEFAALRRQVFSTRELAPLTLKETGSYIEHRLRTSGAAVGDIFEDGAVAAIHRASNGIPRLINHLCNAALRTACDAGQERITREIGIEVTRGGTSKHRSADARKVTLRQVQTGAGEPPGGMEVTSLPAREAGSRFPGGGFAPSASPGEAWEEPAGFSSAVESAEDGSIGRDGDLGVFAGYGKSVTTAALKEGEVLVERLERTLARAERMTSTHEASLAQYAAFEKHLNSLAEGGERLIQRLTHSAHQATETLDGFSGRMDAILEVAESRVGAVESIADRAANLSDGAQEQLQFFEQTCEQANEVESRLTAFAEQLAEKADEVQERLSLLMTGLESSEDVQSRLQATLAKASGFTAQTDQHVDAQCVRVKEAMAEAEQFRDQLTGAALESYRRKMESQFDTEERVRLEALEVARTTLQTASDQAAAVLADALEDHQTKLGENFKTHQRVQQDAIEAAVNEHETIRQQTAALVTRGEQTLKALEDKHHEMLAEFASLSERIDAGVTTARKEIADAGPCMERLEARSKDLQSSSSAMANQLEDTAKRASRLGQTIQDIDSSVDELVERADSSGEKLATVVQRGDKLLAGVQSSCGHVEALQHNVANSLIEIGSASERVASVRDNARKCEEIVTQLALSEAAGGQIAKQLGELLTSAEQVQNSIRQCAVDAAGNCGQLDSQVTTAGRVLQDLSQASEAGSSVIERVDTVGQRADQAATAAREQADRLTSENAAGAQIIARLQETVAQGGELRDTVRLLVAGAAEHVNRLDSHNAAASSVLRKLSAANVAAHANLEEADAAAKSSQESLDNASKQLEQYMQDAQSLTATAHAQTRQLAEHNARAEQLVESIQTSTESGHVLDEKLAECIVEAKNSVMSMAENCDLAQNLVARLGSIRSVLSSAIDAETAVKETLGRAETTYDMLSAMTETAEKREAALGAVTSDAQDLVRTQQELKEKAEVLVEQMNEQLPAGKASLEAGEHLIAEFVKQAEILGTRIEGLHRKAAQAEKTITQATAKPSEIIADARAQAAQLEQVSSAVRKVFAGLSKVSLEARNQVNEFNGTSEEASERLAMLKAETNRASEMLREWVEEAGRSQARLERTLQNCPSIHQTHSADALKVLSEVSKPIARVANPSANGEPPAVAELEREIAVTEQLVPQCDTRSREVSRIIDDAKRSAGSGGRGSRRSHKTEATVHNG